MKITLENLALATKQQIFDQVATHLLTQKVKSATATGSCKYRYNGLMCAAGCLMSDDEYKDTLEGASWVRLAYAGQVPEQNKDFVQSLQRIHDTYLASNWFTRLESFAIVHELSFDEVKYNSL